MTQQTMKIEYTADSKGNIRLPCAAPFDGAPVLIKLASGWCEAVWEDAQISQSHEGPSYDGFCWNVMDGGGTADLDDVKLWAQLPDAAPPICSTASSAQPDQLHALAKKISAKIEQLTHYRDNDCQLDHARVIAEGRISQANQIQHWIAETIAATPPSVGNADAVRKELGPCQKCGCDSYIAGEPSWKHNDDWTAVAQITCDRCDHKWDVVLSLPAALSSAPVAGEWKDITMSDVRLIAGEGKLSGHDVLAAVNGHMRLRLGVAVPRHDRGGL